MGVVDWGMWGYLWVSGVIGLGLCGGNWSGVR